MRRWWWGMCGEIGGRMSHTCMAVIIVGWIVVIVLPALVSVAGKLAGWVDEEE